MISTQFSLLAPEKHFYGNRFNSDSFMGEPTDADDRSTRSIENYSVYIGTDNSFTDVTPIIRDKQ